MSTPNKNPLTEENSSTSQADAPNLLPQDDTNFQVQTEESAPTINPPENEAQHEEAFGAGVWHRGKRINSLYTTEHAKNSWVGIVGTGWVKLTTANNFATNAMTVLSTVGKAKNLPVDYNLDGGEIAELYIW